MNLEQLNHIAEAMVTPGKGLLAADESTGTIAKRFDTIGLDSTFENRRDWRELLFSAEDVMRDYISGVILFDETIRQDSSNGTPLVKLIEAAGSIPGIKVDKGAKPMPGFPGETVTEGLDGLRDRLTEYYELGARFAKWRAVIQLDGHAPSPSSVAADCHALGRYAALCQEANIVPIVEPEVLMDGDHDSARSYEVTAWVLKHLFMELHAQRVELEGIILKPNMVVSGLSASQRDGVEQVAENTLRCLKANVPATVPGIAFLSGGQSDEDATAHLSAMNALGPLPWKLTFSYGRALQAPALQAWGREKNVEAGQTAFRHRARMNGLASTAEWTPQLENAPA